MRVYELIITNSNDLPVGMQAPAKTNKLIQS